MQSSNVATSFESSGHHPSSDMPTKFANKAFARGSALCSDCKYRHRGNVEIKQLLALRQAAILPRNARAEA